jgi:hypothetical protein
MPRKPQHTNPRIVETLGCGEDEILNRRSHRCRNEFTLVALDAPHDTTARPPPVHPRLWAIPNAFKLRIIGAGRSLVGEAQVGDRDPGCCLFFKVLAVVAALRLACLNG